MNTQPLQTQAPPDMPIPYPLLCRSSYSSTPLFAVVVFARAKSLVVTAIFTYLEESKTAIRSAPKEPVLLGPWIFFKLAPSHECYFDLLEVVAC
jgi:hypothetical protein